MSDRGLIMRKKSFGLTTVIAVSLLAACGSGEGVVERRPKTPVPFVAQISINEVMIAQIDKAAHFIWEAVNPENTVLKVRWQEVEHHAITPSRHCADCQW